VDSTHKKNTSEVWYYIIVQNPGTGDEEVMGFEEAGKGRNFIPVFATREDAQQCFLLMPKDLMKNSYEVQAIIQEDVLSHADRHGYGVFLLDARSSVRAKLL
jgi:hypothetical protein